MVRSDCFSYDITNRYVLFCCEGGIEKVVIAKLIEGGQIVVPRKHLVKDPETGALYTGLRSGRCIADLFLRNKDYRLNGDDRLTILRVFDTNPEKLTLPSLYRDRVITYDLLTRPEAEMLVIAKEDAFDEWDRRYRRDKRLKPSEFCKSDLKIGYQKSLRWHRNYWRDADDVANAIRAYDKHHGKQAGKDEHRLSDLLI